MRIRKALKWIGTGLIVMWLILTIFAYYQHRISDEVYVVGTYVEFENYGVLVKDVEIYDYEKRYNNVSNYEIFNWLPQSIVYKIYRVMSYYSTPTTDLELGPEYVVNCEIISEDGNKFDADRQDLRIALYDTLPVEYYPRRSWSLGCSEIDNIVRYHYEGKWFDKEYKGLSLKDYNTGEVIVIPFSEPSITKTYTFSKPKNSKLDRSASDVMGSFITRYSHDSKEEVLNYIYHDQSDGVDWSLLNGISRDVVNRYKLSYDGKDSNQRDLFNLLIETVDDQTLNFKMIYSDEEWWIYDF